MTVPGNDTLMITLLATFTACGGYAAGRLHQWYRTGLDRDEAYRDGYDTATRSVFGLAARLISPKRAVRGTAVVTSAPAASRSGAPVARFPGASVESPPAGLRPAALATPDSVAASSRSGADGPVAPPADSGPGEEVGGRHQVPDELVQAPTYRLTPDRVARAKVRQASPEDDKEQETSRLPSVPRPRSS